MRRARAECQASPTAGGAVQRRVVPAQRGEVGRPAEDVGVQEFLP